MPKNKCLALETLLNIPHSKGLWAKVDLKCESFGFISVDHPSAGLNSDLHDKCELDLHNAQEGPTVF